MTTNQPTYAKARLSSLDDSLAFEFLINPENLTESHNGEYSNLPVLGTGQPLVKYKYSGSSLVIPEVKFWSDRNDQNLLPALEQLQKWTKPDPETLEPDTLKFTWGQLNYPRVYLSRFTYSVTLREQGTAYPVKATGSMELLLAPETPTTETKPETRLTPRERETNLEKVKQALRDRPALAQQLGINAQSTLRVTEGGAVEAQMNNRWLPIGRLEQILGEGLRPGLRQ